MYGMRAAPSNASEAMAAFGLPADVQAQVASRMAPADDEQSVTPWPENATAVALFTAMSTQWRMGSGGPVGLDMAALPVVAKGLRVRPGRAASCMPQLLTMQDEALTVMAEQAERASRAH